MAELDAQPDRYRVAKRLRWLAKHDVPAERPSLKCSLYALANELDGGLPGPHPDYLALSREAQGAE